MDSFIKIVEVLPWWPAVLLISIWIFKDEIKNLFARITSIESSMLGIKTTDHPQSGPSEGKQWLEVMKDRTDIPPVYLSAIDEKSEMIKRYLGINEPTPNEERLSTAAASFACALAVEKAYRAIFSSQVEALNMIGSYGSSVPIKHIREIYLAAKNKSPEVYESYTFEQWLEYLEAFELIVVTAEDVALTDLGKAFIPHLVDVGYSLTPNDY